MCFLWDIHHRIASVLGYALRSLVLGRLADIMDRVLRELLIYLIDESLRQSLLHLHDNIHIGNMMILMIHLHPRPNPSRVSSLHRPPIFSIHFSSLYY
jgi:hypothetical protein